MAARRATSPDRWRPAAPGAPFTMSNVRRRAGRAARRSRVDGGAGHGSVLAWPHARFTVARGADKSRVSPPAARLSSRPACEGQLGPFGSLEWARPTSTRSAAGGDDHELAWAERPLVQAEAPQVGAAHVDVIAATVVASLDDDGGQLRHGHSFRVGVLVRAGPGHGGWSGGREALPGWRGSSGGTKARLPLPSTRAQPSRVFLPWWCRHSRSRRSKTVKWVLA